MIYTQTCQNCNKPISGQRKRKYCSEYCAIDYNNKKSIERKCHYCKQTFQARLKEIKRGFGRYCSQTCASKSNNALREYESHDPNTNCANCDKPLYRKPSRIKKWTIFFCTKHCQHEYRVKNRQIPDYTGQQRKRFSIACKDIYGEICEICQWGKARCDTHHVIQRCNQGTDDVSNGMILCPNHHRLADKIEAKTRKELMTKLERL